MLSLKKIAVLLLSISILYGCGNSAAPTNDLTELDKIAENMMSIVAKKGYKIPFSSKDSYQALNEGFDKTGYSYSATLEKLASNGVSIVNQAEYKAAFFMLAPLLPIAEKHLSKEESLRQVADIYPSDEFKSVSEIVRMMDEQSVQAFFRSDSDRQAEYDKKIQERDAEIKQMREKPDQYSKYR